MDPRICAIALALGISLGGCGLLGNERSLEDLAPLLNQGSAELGSQSATIFTMQAVGCAQYLEGNTVSQSVALMQQGSKMEGEYRPDDSGIQKYLACVQNMQTTAERQRSAPNVSIVVPAQ